VRLGRARPQLTSKRAPKRNSEAPSVRLTRSHDRAVFDQREEDRGPAKVRPSTYQPVARSEAAVKDVQ
jgi:hypothetical protein